MNCNSADEDSAWRGVSEGLENVVETGAPPEEGLLIQHLVDVNQQDEVEAQAGFE